MSGRTVRQVEPENEQQPTPSIDVYDLPPGAGPVVHHASSGGETPVSAADTPPAKQPPDSLGYTFLYLQPDGKHDTIAAGLRLASTSQQTASSRS